MFQNLLTKYIKRLFYPSNEKVRDKKEKKIVKVEIN